MKNNLSGVKPNDLVYNYITDSILRVMSILAKGLLLSDHRIYTLDGKFDSSNSNPVIFLDKDSCRQYLREFSNEPAYYVNPFDKVLVRDASGEPWTIDIFIGRGGNFTYKGFRGDWNKCIPYESNEHLLGKL